MKKNLCIKLWIFSNIISTIFPPWKLVTFWHINPLLHVKQCITSHNSSYLLFILILLILVRELIFCLMSTQPHGCLSFAWISLSVPTPQLSPWAFLHALHWQLTIINSQKCCQTNCFIMFSIRRSNLCRNTYKEITITNVGCHEICFGWGSI